ncbi:MAG: ISL3 family transposase [Chitinophagales bacterium]
MKPEQLFGAAIGLQSPWFIKQVEFKEEGSHRVLHLFVDYERGIDLLGKDGKVNKAYDHVERTWRHLNFFQHECYLHATVPRIRQDDGSTQMVTVPWASEGSSFTLLFEAFAIELCKSGLSLSAAGRLLGIDGRIIGRIIRRYVEEARYSQPLEQVRVMGVDETSSRKGHNYLTVLTDMEQKKVVGIGVGRNEKAFLAALQQCAVRQVEPQKVEKVVMDLSPSYKAAVSTHLAAAEIVFDRFHLEQLVSKALDEVRRKEAAHSKQLKNTKYLWLRRGSDLGIEQMEQLQFLSSTYPQLGKTYRFKEWFKEICNSADPNTATWLMKEWLYKAQRSNIAPIQKVAQSLKAHWSGIVQYFESRLTSGYVERVNLKIQEIKRMAKGYRNMENFIIMIYFHLGKLNLQTHKIW